jgi:hypothetical protein
MSRRYTHRPWSTFEPGDWITGTWHEAPRVCANKGGGGGWYYIGVVRQIDDSLVGITIPTQLKQHLLELPVGSGVRIKYLGSVPTRKGTMYTFDVDTWPVAEQP